MDRKVLLVEDEVLVAALAADILEELGYRAIEAATAAAALEIAATQAANLVFAIVDVGLPDARGDALVLQLRAFRADLPVIVATGYGEAHLDERLRGHQRTMILSKPYDVAQLQAAINAVI
jgi:DNA-binding response OmpR family regulator